MLGYAVAFLSVTAGLLVARLSSICKRRPVSLFLLRHNVHCLGWRIQGGRAGRSAFPLSFKYYFLAPLHSLAWILQKYRVWSSSTGRRFRSGDHRGTKRSEEKLRKTARELQANIEDLNRTQHELHKAQAELAHMTRVNDHG